MTGTTFALNPRMDLLALMCGSKLSCLRPALRSSGKTLCSAVMLVGMMHAGPGYAEGYQSHSDIRSTVKGFVHKELRGSDFEVEVGKLDGRLRLRQCTSALEAFWPPGARQKGRGSVGVRCQDEKPWRMFVRVNIKVYERVATLARPKVRGEALNPGDVVFERKDVTLLHAKYLTDVETVAGYKFRRAVKTGEVLSVRMLKVPHAVKRGEQVTILADTGGIQVTMRGQALSDGKVGSVIRVRNSSSNRVVEGEIVDKGVVKVRF